MAKRVRSRSAHRPGGQGPSRTKKSDDATETTDAGMTGSAAEEVVSDADYSEVEVDEVAAAAVATTATPKATTATPKAEPTGTRRSRRRRGRSSKQRADDLPSRAAAESVWVREDLRRIGVVSVILLVALALSWVVFGVVDVLNLY